MPQALPRREGRAEAPSGGKRAEKLPFGYVLEGQRLGQALAREEALDADDVGRRAEAACEGLVGVLLLAVQEPAHELAVKGAQAEEGPREAGIRRRRHHGISLSEIESGGGVRLDVELHPPTPGWGCVSILFVPL